MEQRVIKFRVWNGSQMEYNVMAGKFGIFYINPANNGLDGKDSSCITQFNTKYSDSIPLMQFTGLHDKEGKEIYEGDIVKVFEEDEDYNACYEVHWGDHYPAFSLKGHEDLEYNSLQHATCVVSCEVLGNIYEHPHLLNS